MKRRRFFLLIALFSLAGIIGCEGEREALQGFGAAQEEIERGRELTESGELTDFSPKTGKITGRVFDQVTQQGIAGATVEIGDRTVKTGPDGSFSISGLAITSYPAKVTARGYRDKLFPVKLTREKSTTNINVAMQPR